MRKLAIFLMIALIAILGSCAQPTPETITETIIETVTVIETQVIEKEAIIIVETVEVVKIVEIQVEVTPTPKPVQTEQADAVLGVLPRNQTLIVDNFSGQVDSPNNFNKWIGTKNPDRGMQNLANEPLWSVDFATGEIINGLAVGDPVYNEDFTELVIPLREGVAWHDGMPFTSADVVFTIETLMTYESFTANKFFEENVASVSALDDYTVVFELKLPNSRFHTAFLDRDDCTWIMPKHIFERITDPVTYDFNPFIGTGPYKLHSHDQAGLWTIWEKRQDWSKSPTGILYGEPIPEYIVFQNFANENTKIQAQLNHQADIINLSYDGMLAILTQSDSSRAYQPTFPWVVNNDPAVTGITYNTTRTPYNNPDVRWALTLAIDIAEYINQAVDGTGTMSPIHIPQTGSYTKDYIEPMQDWLEDLEIDLGDGERFSVYNPSAASPLFESAKNQGYSFPKDPEYITQIFGLGWYKYAPEAAERLLLNNDFSRDTDGRWLLPNDTPWKLLVITGTDPDHPSTRNAQAVVAAWQKFGIDAEVLATEANDNLSAIGDFDVSSKWPAREPWGAGTDLYRTLEYFSSEYGTPLGDVTNGHPSRWSSPEMETVIEDLRNTNPYDNRALITAGTNGLKLLVEAMPGTPTFGNIGFIAWDEYYWTNWPGAESLYSQPYAYWTTFKYMTPFLVPTGR